ncbi:MAG: polysaccharide deacetylase family protein [Thaumarchaeota archaeon]|nr:polysaccharide deacetylase family protein [Nitrososphaerota archaeon]
MVQIKTLIPLILIFSIIFEPSYSAPSCQCVAFRMDDVQDYWVDNAQIAIMHVFHKKHTSLTIGIIGNIFGDDPTLIQYIKNNIKNESSIEIANHGWNHENFTDFNKKQQSLLMEKTDKKLTKLFGIKPTVFLHLTA